MSVNDVGGAISNQRSQAATVSTDVALWETLRAFDLTAANHLEATLGGSSLGGVAVVNGNLVHLLALGDVR